jgi:hypothetical protein
MSMKQCISAATLVIFAGALLLASTAIAQQDAARPVPQDIGAMSGHLPKIHYVPSDSLRTFPIWVDASMVLNRDGIINPLIEKPEGQAFLRSPWRRRSRTAAFLKIWS